MRSEVNINVLPLACMGRKLEKSKHTGFIYVSSQYATSITLCKRTVSICGKTKDIKNNKFEKITNSLAYTLAYTNVIRQFVHLQVYGDTQ